MLSVNADPELALARRRIAHLELVLDDALEALESGATMRQRALVRLRIRAALLQRRTLKR